MQKLWASFRRRNGEGSIHSMSRWPFSSCGTFLWPNSYLLIREIISFHFTSTWDAILDWCSTSSSWLWILSFSILLLKIRDSLQHCFTMRTAWRCWFFITMCHVFAEEFTTRILSRIGLCEKSASHCSIEKRLFRRRRAMLQSISTQNTLFRKYSNSKYFNASPLWIIFQIYAGIFCEPQPTKYGIRILRYFFFIHFPEQPEWIFLCVSTRDSDNINAYMSHSSPLQWNWGVENI